jgi:hypothetical protein
LKIVTKAGRFFMSDVPEISPEVREWLESVPEEYLRCRLFHHNWDLTHELGTYFVDNEGQPDEVWRQELTCARCHVPGVDFHEPWTMTRVGTRRILYGEVEGYLAPVPVRREQIRMFLAEQQKGKRRIRRRSGGRTGRTTAHAAAA